VESRKVQEVTGGTFTVSLPESWAEDVGVSAGSVVNLHVRQDGTLAVRPPGDETDGLDEVTVTCPGGVPGCVERVLRSAYVAGVDEVVLEASSGFSTADRRAVESTTRALTGVTVGQVDDDRIPVRAVLDTDQVSVPQSVRLLEFVAISSHREATTALVDGSSVDDPGAAVERAARLLALVDRHFQRALVRPEAVDALGVTRVELFALRTTARELERVAGEAERVARVANVCESPLRADLGDDVADVAATARSVVADAVAFAVGEGDETAAWDAFDRTDRVTAAVEERKRTLATDDDVDHRLASVLDALDRTAAHGRTIAQLGIGQAIRDGTLAPEAIEGDEAVDQGADA
jgi:phosphate uptake regulator